MEVSTLVVWMITLTVSLCAIVLSAAAGMPEVHMAMTAFVGIAIALLGIREHRQLLASGADRSTVAASTARYMGLVWVWGALGLLITYFFILKWHEWLHFFLGFAALGVLCLFVAATLSRDASKGTDDETMLKVGRALTWGQFAGMVITMLGLIIDGKMTRFLNPAKYGDWAANNIFFFGALALAAISLNALLTTRKTEHA